jgi:probable HAF family extracellular repeat protein
MRTIRLSALSLAALTAMVIGGAPAAVGAPPAAGPPPTFTPLGPIDANVLSMSADGSVLVGVNIFGGATFRWSPRRGTQDLGAASGEISISRDGSTIVADASATRHMTAAVWRGGTHWRSLGGYAGSHGCPDLSNAFAVSNDGSVVVGLGWNDCKATGFRWDAANGMVSLGSLDGYASRANDVSADGSVIVGWDDAADGSRRGARWVNGVESLLSTGGVFLGGAEAVTADGSVLVGGNAGPQGNQAYRWTEDKGSELLGKLPGGGGLAGATAFATTDNGKVVVGASGAAKRDAFVWTKATGMFKLQDYLVGLGVTGLDGWRLDTALAISADGTKIAGWGINPDGHVQSWLVDNLPPFADTAG